MKEKRIVTVTIATKNRPEVLDSCIASILTSSYPEIKVEILCTNIEKDIPVHLHNNKDFLLGNHIHIRENLDMMAVEAQNYLITHSLSDYYFAVSDDVKLFKDCIEQAVDCLEKFHPDGDGLIGVNTDNMPEASQCCFMLFGQMFTRRFPDFQPFCPEYKHFYADTELGIYGRVCGRFHFCEDSRLFHAHASTCSDETHRGARSVWPNDKKTFEERRKKEEVWGRLK